MDGLREPVTLEGVLFGLAAYGGFIVLLFLLTKFLPGPRVQGQPLPASTGQGGKRLTYKMNGMALFVATHMLIFVVLHRLGWSLTPLLREFWSLLVAANLITLAWLALMFRAGKRKLAEAAKAGEDDAELREHGPLSRLWLGIELNPSLWGVDLKVFAYQPSLIGLGVLNVAFAVAQYEALGHLTPQMIAYQVFWWGYLFSHYWLEDNVLSMWDVIAEKFGFMLLWGDLVLVPFFYCIGGWWVLNQTEPMPWSRVALIAALHVVGLWIFRESNAQKNRFKKDRSVKIWGKPAETIGDRLLISGWWGIGRKLNYTGEIMVYMSFALCTGLSSIVPYLLPLWLCCLLPHRAWRDEQRCAAKYGELWVQYTKIAKFRMIPFIY
ncbi:c-24(28) sterol reductase, putative [Plesiocystis pacifica SIR-1]|uniref:Delta(14)-sterol reductase n=1 Tax=Plesiocystis pacifica SIR-1 TaxID=391625 RepID=A6GC73_9BACT|nr:c-24(28) sterol reductase [Plesiocystis pacifica]EDM76522.1 c-24(28) sterol reductase, putative [Plesiocystis pacifica SIR-1]